jgi:hypothetical protein
LLPGESATVRFTTAMSAGMDGPHLFQVSVPTNHPHAQTVQYHVKADFR